MRKNLREAFIILLLFVALAFIHLFIYTQNINMKYEIENAKRKYLNLHSENRNLRAVVEKKKSLSRIENIAINKLHMIRPKTINYVKMVTEESTN